MSKIDYNNLPKHIGIILDGNGRWATKRGLPRELGHKEGVEAIKRVVQAAKEIGIKVVSMYAFSTENWKRKQSEVDAIFDLLRKYLKSQEGSKDSFLGKNIQVRTMGDITKLPTDVYNLLENLKNETKDCDGLVLNLGLNYGGRSEIISAIKSIPKDKIDSLTEQDFLSYLYTAGLPELDLVIRASGEQRLSNFMLYQCAYSEFYFPKTLWPDFNKKHLEKAIISYQTRDRRFGMIKEKK